MIILSHRGYWLNQEEKNTEKAFLRSFNLGFGTETDIRDYQGGLIISHDMPTGQEIKFEDFLKIWSPANLPLAINIKADGLAQAIKASFDFIEHTNFFAFDMSIPDMLSYIKLDLPVFTRLSEVEKEPIWLEYAKGIWLDAFSYNWFNSETIETLLRNNKQVCIVSSELHQREYAELWNILKPFKNSSSLMLCTDLPEHAKEFFGETK